MLPLPVDLLPDSRLIGSHGDRRSIAVQLLHQAGITDDSDISNHANARRSCGREFGRAGARQIEIELVKWQPGNQMPVGFRFKTGDLLIAQAGIGRPVSSINGLQQFLGNGQEFGFRSGRHFSFFCCKNLIRHTHRSSASAADLPGMAVVNRQRCGRLRMFGRDTADCQWTFCRTSLYRSSS